MTTVTTRCERCNVTPPLLVSGNNVAVDALPDRSQDGITNHGTGEYLLRQIQNVTGGGTAVKVTLQDTSTAAEYHYLLADNGILNIPILGRVSVFAAVAFTVATIEIEKTQG